jgi:hypothetical protein
MKTLRTIDELNWALGIYSNIVKFGSKSILLENSEECLAILEEFEEYEKCHDLFEVLKNKKEDTQI